MRESPSLEMIKILEKEYEAEVVVFDPYFPDKNTYTTLDLTLKESEAIILATNHDAFINIPYTDYNNLLVLVD
jgi:UDP-N-acetyl-D-mannosaminuronate dehydrogenase